MAMPGYGGLLSREESGVEAPKKKNIKVNVDTGTYQKDDPKKPKKIAFYVRMRLCRFAPRLVVQAQSNACMPVCI